MQDKSKYETPTAFKSALETRLKARAKQSNRPYPTLRKLVAFDRLLARIFANQDNSFALKGGYSLELRLGKSRTTKDLIQRGIDPIETAKRMQAVFAARSTHALPEELNPPPQSWGKIFAKHAEELEYPGTMEDAYQTVKRFFSDQLLITKSDKT